MAACTIEGLDEAFRVLGVRPETEPADVRRAFRQLVRTLHPDVNPAPDAGRSLAAVVDAHRLLTAHGRAAAAPARPAVRVEPLRHVDVYA